MTLYRWLFAVFLALNPENPALNAGTYTINWPAGISRTWVGPDLWANRLQDWKTRLGRLECVESDESKPFRTVHLLSHRLENGLANSRFEVDLGASIQGQSGSRDSLAGFLIGVGHPGLDYRSAALIHHGIGKGAGLLAGIGPDRTLQILDLSEEGLPDSGEKTDFQLPSRIRLILTSRSIGNNQVLVQLSAVDPTDQSGLEIGSVEKTIPAFKVTGGLGLVSHPGRGKHTVSYWFQNWHMEGPGIVYHQDRKLGPIVGAQYTVSRGVMKLTAQLMPVSDSDSPQAHFQVRDSSTGQWVNLQSAEVIVPGWTAAFKITDWDDEQDYAYRIAYDALVEGGVRRFTFQGRIRRNPSEKNEFVLAGFTGNHNTKGAVDRPWYDWTPNDLWFPHTDIVKHVTFQNPDLLFFSGDQVYEGASPTGADKSGEETSYLDYLYKWYLWSWAYRDLTADIPCVAIPDDHDVYQGNIWGQSGRFALRDHDGGYLMPPEWINMVQRTQTSHLPDPYDPTPIDRGITVYYTDLVWGGIGFAILEDRKFKTGPNGVVPETGSGRPDHVIDPSFDPASADVAGAQLLGPRQHRFLEDFTLDWRRTEMKVALSQTVFAGLATHHGPTLEYLVADYDSNGWPQSGRNKALSLLRRASVFMVGGDQHLATVAQHGIRDWEDAGWSFCVPSIANFYPRAWNPPVERDPSGSWPPDKPAFTGRFKDGLGNRVTVHAATNPGLSFGREPLALHDRMPGYGIVRFNKAAKTIRMECWPRFADPSLMESKPYEGWPVIISMYDNDGRKAFGHLPLFQVTGIRRPVVQIIDEIKGDTVSSLRMNAPSFRPMVFEDGLYTVKVGDPDQGAWKTVRSLRPTEDPEEIIVLGF